MAHVSTDRFSRKDRTFSTEASDFGKTLPFSRIHPDSCDVGITLINHVTGNEAVYALFKVHRDNDSEVTHWELRPTTETLRKHPQLRDTKVFIFND